MADQTMAAESGASTALVGPFTLRDVIVAVSVALLFLASVLPTAVVRGIGLNLWNSAGLFQLGLSILLPAAVLVLFVIRRVAPRTKLRIGSLSVDQFASVTASFATAFYFLVMVNVFSIGAAVGFLGSLGLLASTVFAPWIPQLAADFAGRQEIPAHPVARDAVPAQPKAARPAAAAPQPKAPEAGTADAAVQPAAAGAAAGTQPSGPVQGKEVRTGATAASTAAAAPAAAAAAPSGAGAGKAAAPAAAAGKGARKPAGKAAAAASSATAGDEVAPGAADGEAMGIPVTEHAPAGTAGTAEPKAGGQSGAGPVRTAGSARPEAAGKTSRPGTAGQPVSAQKAPAGQAAGSPQTAGTVQGAAAAGAAQAGQVQQAATAAAAPSAAGQDRAPANGQARGANRQAAHGAEGGAAGAGAAGGGAAGGSNGATVALDTVSERRDEPISATRENTAEAEETVYEAFWFAVGRTRPVFDENTGAPIFTLEPGAWILALQDRGDEFLVQHTDGRVGVLRDLTNIERA